MRKIKSSLAPLLAAALMVGAALPATAQAEANDSPITEADALATTEAWFEAYDEGSVAGMLALMAPDAELAEIFGPMPLEEWETFYTWKLAEGTQLVDRECSATAEEDSAEVTVECDYAHLPYSHRLVGAPAVPHTLTQVIGPDGITAQRQRFDERLFRPRRRSVDRLAPRQRSRTGTTARHSSPGRHRARPSSTATSGPSPARSGPPGSKPTAAATTSPARARSLIRSCSVAASRSARPWWQNPSPARAD